MFLSTHFMEKIIFMKVFSILERNYPAQPYLHKMEEIEGEADELPRVHYFAFWEKVERGVEK